MELENILKSENVKAKVQEVYGEIRGNIATKPLSQEMKYDKYSGDPSKVIIARRLVKRKGQEYGSAFENYFKTGTGDDKKQIVTEYKITPNQEGEAVWIFKDSDIERGNDLVQLIDKVKDSMTKQIEIELDNAFFAEAEQDATVVTPTATDELEKLEELIVELETLENQYVDGVDRSTMILTLSPTAFSKVRNALDKEVNSNVDTAVEYIYSYHGVEVKKNLRQTADALLTVNKEVVSQPVSFKTFNIAQVTPLKRDYVIKIDYVYGTKTIAPDLAFKIATI